MAPDLQWGNIMAEDKPNFDIGLDYDSDDDNSIFLKQEPRQNRQNLYLNESFESIDLENMLNNTKDSAFDGDSSFKKILATQVEINDGSENGQKRDCYKPQVKDISSDE